MFKINTINNIFIGDLPILFFLFVIGTLVMTYEGEKNVDTFSILTLKALFSFPSVVLQIFR